jgi:50S ribosomal protein L16 3-hydroxylase
MIRRASLSPALQFPPGLDAAGFLQTYWQRRPLLFPKALPNVQNPLSANELAGLACEPEIESRIVLERDGNYPWEVRHGPFGDADFSSLPESHWTLLVQDVDKQIPQVADLLDSFRFIPDWRVDDIMISFAADGGSVGPHVDEYDVFLLQTDGRRRWQFDSGPTPDLAFVPDLELRVLQRFDPREEHILEQGDLLYLPPGVPHWGIAKGPCVTCSIGFRAATWRELGASWSEFIAEKQLPTERYRDQMLAPQANSGEILPLVFDQIREVLERGFRDESGQLLREWFGRFVTEPKENLQVFPRDDPLTAADLRSRFENGETLLRNGFSRMAFSRSDKADDLLYANGDAYSIPPGHSGFLALLTREKALSLGNLADWLERPACTYLLCQLYNDGHYEPLELPG